MTASNCGRETLRTSGDGVTRVRETEVLKGMTGDRGRRSSWSSSASRAASPCCAVAGMEKPTPAHRHRRQGRQRLGPSTAASPWVSVLGALPAHERLREHGLRVKMSKRPARRPRVRARRRREHHGLLNRKPRPCRRVSASASPSPGHIREPQVFLFAEPCDLDAALRVRCATSCHLQKRLKTTMSMSPTIRSSDEHGGRIGC